MIMTIEENKFQAFVLTKKIAKLLIDLGVLKSEEDSDSIKELDGNTIKEFNFNGVNYIFNLRANEVSVSKIGKNEYYDISLDIDLPSNSDSVNPGRDYPDWLVSKLFDLYDFLKA